MQSLSFLLAGFTLVGLWAFASADATDASAEVMAAHLMELQVQLEADEFRAREKATRELTSIGISAIPVVSKAVASPDLETSTRGFSILKAWLEGDDVQLSQQALATIETLAKHPSPSVARRAQALQSQAAGIAEKAARTRLVALGAVFGDHNDDSEQAEDQINQRVLRIGKNWKGTPADLTLIRRLTTVSKLKLSEREVTADWLKALDGSAVVELDLSQTDLDDAGLLGLPKLNNLTQLDLSETLVGSDGIEGVLRQKKLERLFLRGTLISDDGLAKLKDLPALNYLQLTKTRVSRKGFVVLAEFSALETLDVRQTKFASDGLKASAVSKSLRTIHGAGSALTVVDVQSFEKAFPDSSIKVHSKPVATPFDRRRAEFPE